MMNKKSKRRKYKTVNKRIPKNKVNKNALKKNTAKRGRRRTKKRKITKGGVKRKERDGECAICLEDFNEEDNPDIITLGCGHSFHRNCIINTCRHMQGPCTCPLCREPLTNADLNKLGIGPPPTLDTVEDFKNYINDKLRAPTRRPIEKLENELDYFLGRDVLPLELSDGDYAMEFDLEQIGPELFYRYRFLRIVPLEDIPRNRLNKKYFRYITYEEAGELDDFAEDQLDQAGIILYNVIEL
jgi:hypothetical protein